MNKTTNYQLNKWEITDRILMQDFNSDNDTIGAALKAHDDDIAALETAVAGKGNCQIEYQTYIGTGTSGAGNPTTLTFSAQPLMVVIFGCGTLMITSPQLTQCIFTSYNTNFQPSNFSPTWNGNQLSMYSAGSGTGVSNPSNQMNTINQTYIVLAFYNAETE